MLTTIIDKIYCKILLLKDELMKLLNKLVSNLSVIYIMTFQCIVIIFNSFIAFIIFFTRYETENN